MNCVIDNPTCDGTACANCRLLIAIKERDEAREVARGLYGQWYRKGERLWDEHMFPWLKEEL